jgi:hypothetical protein
MVACRTARSWQAFAKVVFQEASEAIHTPELRVTSRRGHIAVLQHALEVPLGDVAASEAVSDFA